MVTAKETGDNSVGTDVGAVAPPCRAGGTQDGVATVDSRPAFPPEVTLGVTVGPGNPTPQEAGTHVSTQDSVHDVPGGTFHNTPDVHPEMAG